MDSCGSYEGNAGARYCTVLHELVEQNLPQTLKKLVRYTLPQMIEEILKNQ